MYDTQINSLQQSFDGLQAESREGTAIAITLGGMHVPDGRERAITLRLGNFRSGNAIAAGGAFRLPDSQPTGPDVVVDFGISHGLEYSQNGGSVGITWSW